MKNRLFKILNDWYINLALLSISIFLIIQSADYPETARTFPRLILIFLFVLILMDTAFKIRAIKNRPVPPGDSPGGPAGTDTIAEKTPNSGKGPLARHLYLLATIILMFVFLLLVYLVSFIPAALIFIPLASWVLGYRNLKKLILSSVGVTCFMYIIFIVIMKSNLPEGILVELLLR